ncbi:hypothetical protein BpHYR1_047785 [Brachionus plicatilis]|uniref:Uncharacterized protein n=1 Tax=Brachionus plicatilis TaxID=10195 RepID=A0A3M7T866_BRAPC|nr:hypothetical protein BpHYR1_047785 [Brachionus plicatilis]
MAIGKKNIFNLIYNLLNNSTFILGKIITTIVSKNRENSDPHKLPKINEKAVNKAADCLYLNFISL